MVKELPGYPVQNSPSVSFLSWGGAVQGRNSIWYCVNEMPQKEILDKTAYTSSLVFYGRLSPLFQFSLSAVTLVYLSQWTAPSRGENTSKEQRWAKTGSSNLDLYFFVDVYILPTPTFCGLHILLTHIFFQPLHFVADYILSTPIFCWHQYFVDAYIILTPMLL